MSSKAGKEDVARLESGIETDLARVEAKLDGLIIRLVPEGRP